MVKVLVESNISNVSKEFGNKSIELDVLNETIEKADIVVLLVDHTPFKSIDLELLSGKQIIDTRGIWS